MRINAGVLSSLLQADLDLARWNGAMNPYPGQTVRQFAMASLNRSLVKKYLSGTSDTTPEADAAALEKFTEVNDSCRRYAYDTSGRPDWVREALGEAQAFIYRFFYPDAIDCILSLSEISRGFGVGPGSSIGSPETDLYSKFSLSDLSATSSVLHVLYKQAIRHNPLWLELEDFRAKEKGYRIVESSRLSFVPKTVEISRTICTEPVLNMMFQKGIASVLEKRLKQVVGIDLQKQQPKNRELARIGSVTGRFGTIDLSSASDSMSLALVRAFFPAQAVAWLERCRCKTTVLPDGSTLELHMISSMGNGYTFPLQTIFFASLVYGAYRVLGIPLHYPRGLSHGNLAVNGDDIIVVSEAYDLVCEMLSCAGFRVNVDKSFNEGLFRESCGGDYYHGCDVRGVYLKHLRDANDCFSAINRLNRWSTRHRVPLCNLVGYLSRKCRFLPIPYDEDDSHGVKVPLCLLDTKLRRHKGTGGIYYRFSQLSKRSVKVDSPDSGQFSRPGWFYNPSGLLFALLAGSIRNGSIGFRTTARRAGIRRRYSSRWDYIPSAHLERGDYHVDWKFYVALNLGKV